MTSLRDLTVIPPPAGPADWNAAGVAIYPQFFDPAGPVLADYETEWRAANGPAYLSTHAGPGAASVLSAERPGGWPDCTPYMRHPALQRLLCDQTLGQVIADLIGEPAGVHLNLTGWVTTERDWHQDSYLNEPEVGDKYAAVWISLGDIHPDSGPFQYVPGSHRWPQVTRDLIGGHVDLTDPRWPKHSEDILSPLFADEIDARDEPIVSHLPARGDVLIWHGRLLHRGSRANVAGAYRPALIAHYSGINSRPAMPTAVQHPAGGFYFPIGASGPVA